MNRTETKLTLLRKRQKVNVFGTGSKRWKKKNNGDILVVDQIGLANFGLVMNSYYDKTNMDWKWSFVQNYTFQHLGIWVLFNTSGTRIHSQKSNLSSICIRGALNKFPDFFLQAYKIVVDSWKFTMLLLYILWDDWPIFMISASNEQLQKQLEYTLLKPDCHRWEISKMQAGRDDTLKERYARKLCFKLGKQCHRNVWNASDCFWTILNESSISFWVT